MGQEIGRATVRVCWVWNEVWFLVREPSVLKYFFGCWAGIWVNRQTRAHKFFSRIGYVCPVFGRFELVVTGYNRLCLLLLTVTIMPSAWSRIEVVPRSIVSRMGFSLFQGLGSGWPQDKGLSVTHVTTRTRV